MKKPTEHSDRRPIANSPHGRDSLPTTIQPDDRFIGSQASGPARRTEDAQRVLPGKCGVIFDQADGQRWRRADRETREDAVLYVRQDDLEGDRERRDLRSGTVRSLAPSRRLTGTVILAGRQVRVALYASDRIDGHLRRAAEVYIVPATRKYVTRPGERRKRPRHHDRRADQGADQGSGGAGRLAHGIVSLIRTSAKKRGRVYSPTRLSARFFWRPGRIPENSAIA